LTIPRQRAATLVLVIGLLVALGAAGLLFLSVIDPGPAALIGIVGIGLIGASTAMRSARA
jgi:hypothetical protein